MSRSATALLKDTGNLLPLHFPWVRSLPPLLGERAGVRGNLHHSIPMPRWSELRKGLLTGLCRRFLRSLRFVLTRQQMGASERLVHMAVQLPKGGPDRTPTGNEHQIHTRLYVWIVQPHGLTQQPADTIAGYSLANTFRRDKTTAAEREVVRSGYKSERLRRPRCAVCQDGSKITLFLDLLRLVQSSWRVHTRVLCFSNSRSSVSP